MTQKYRVVTNAIITNKGKILLGKKEEKESHPVSGEWHFLEGHLDEGEDPEEAVKREVKDETGLDVDIHQLVDVTSNSDLDSPFQVFYHLEADSRDAEANDDLEKVKWVEAGNIEDEIGRTYEERIQEREELEKFFERIEKAPY